MTKQEGRNYQILNTIATGGTAVLYKAIQTSLDRPVVVKRLHSHLTSDPNFRKRFELEAKAAASLDHENIVRIIDFGSSQDNHYIVMEFIDGFSLKELMDKQGVLDEEHALLIAHEICMGLDHAHQRGIIHRDIKPANIMITNEGQVKITDFGLAKLHQSQTQQTIANTLLGTPLYMSPEQAIGDQIDGRSDLFSLGTICYEMITGTQPFMGDNYAAVIQNIINGTLPPPSKIGRDISPEAESLVMKALSREPARRFRSALEMMRSIESFLGQENILGARYKLCRLISGKENAYPATREKSKKRVRPGIGKILPLVLAASFIAAAVVLFALDPGRLVELKSRITALKHNDPIPPEPGSAAQNVKEIIGSQLTMTPLDQSGIGAAEADTASFHAPVPGADSLSTAQADSTALARVDAVDGDIGTPEPASDVKDASASEGKTPERASSQADESRLAARTGYLDIIIEPEADIYLDGAHKQYGFRFGPSELPAGKHEIVCRKEGYREYRETVAIKKGELSRRRIQMQPLTGSIVLETESGVQIFIDGFFKCTTPNDGPIVIPVGSHTVELRKAGYESWKSEVYIPPDETLTLKIKLVAR
jgi:serine/threonine protein kinase